jgi:hypothetical protein
MVINFKICGISGGARKLVRTLMLIIIIIKKVMRKKFKASKLNVFPFSFLLFVMHAFQYAFRLMIW